MQIDDSQLITDPRMLRIAGGVLGLVVLGFLFQGPLGYEPATVALMGATLLLLITRQDPHEALREVEWSTLFFFVGLFIVVGGLEEVDPEALPFRMVTNVGRLERMLREADLEGFELSTHVFPDETHMTVYPLNYYRGIQMVYGRGRSIFESRSEQ